MEPVRYVLFAIAAVFYVLAWKNIHTLVHEVNRGQPERHFTTVGWWRHRYEAWHLHAQLYPSSVVRKRIAWSLLLTVAFMLGVMLVMVRQFIASHP
jgi:hypothetical protein